MPLIAQSSLGSARRVLDVGCGTGTFAIQVKRLEPALEVVGLDPDPGALARSRRKAARAGVSIEFVQGFSDSLPYPSACFDRVFSSFMFHHVPPAERPTTLEEIRRVLAPGGSFHLVDFSRPEEPLPWLARHIHSGAHLRDNSDSGILALLAQAGFPNPRKVASGATFFGHARASYFLAEQPR
jgi:ubiquinone/menaquinone biosynthesis C-methylase UbiE